MVNFDLIGNNSDKEVDFSSKIDLAVSHHKRFWVKKHYGACSCFEVKIDCNRKIS